MMNPTREDTGECPRQMANPSKDMIESPGDRAPEAQHEDEDIFHGIRLTRRMVVKIAEIFQPNAPVDKDSKALAATTGLVDGHISTDAKLTKDITDPLVMHRMQMSEPAGKRARVEWFQGLHTLRPHPEKAKLFQIRGRDKKTTEDSQNKIHYAETENQFEDSEGSLGKLVWGCIGDQRWWPGMVIHGDLCGCRPAKAGHLWVFWFGDHKISEVLMSKTVDFIENFTQKIGKSVSGKLYKEALSEVLQECVRRTGLECPKNLITWALNGFTGFTKIMLASRPGEAIPSSILVHLDSIAEDMQESDQSMKKADSKGRRDVIQVDSTHRQCPYPSSSSSSDMRDFGSPATKFSPQDIKSSRKFSNVSSMKACKQAGNNVSQQSDQYELGQLVWACLCGHSWWPAIVVRGSNCGLEPAKPEHVWVFWFGDNRVSEVSLEKLVPFAGNFEILKQKKWGKLYNKAVTEMLLECARRVGVVPEDIFDWGADCLPSTDTSLLRPDKTHPIPDVVQVHLDKITVSIRYSQGDDSSTSSDDSDDEPGPLEIEQEIDSRHGLNVVKAGNLPISMICISCNRIIRIVTQHPLFEGGLCKKCRSDWMTAAFGYGQEDGSQFYCAICSSGGDLFICSDAHCYRVYCTACIRNFVGEKALKTIHDAEEWHCFMCTEWQEDTHGLLRGKEDWKRNIIVLFQPEDTLWQPPALSETSRRPVRVLSLFNGIGTGKYYSS